MTEGEIRKYKLIYTDITVSDFILDEKWKVVEPLLLKRDPKNKFRVLFYAVPLVLILIIISLTLLFQAGRVNTVVSDISSVAQRIVGGFSPKSGVENNLPKLNEITKEPTPTQVISKKQQDQSSHGSGQVKGVSSDSSGSKNNGGPASNVNSNGSGEGVSSATTHENSNPQNNESSRGHQDSNPQNSSSHSNSGSNNGNSNKK